MNEKQAHSLAVAMAKGIMGRDYREAAEPAEDEDNVAYRIEPTDRDRMLCDLIGGSQFRCSKCNNLIEMENAWIEEILFCPFCGRKFIGGYEG